jgi:hypothetical protein
LGKSLKSSVTQSSVYTGKVGIIAPP